MAKRFVLICIASINSGMLAQPAGKFTSAGNMIRPRAFHTATLLTSGKVLIAGGIPAVTSAELYDPGTRLFTLAGDMTTGRVYHTATLLPDGKVLIVGGCVNLTSSGACVPPSLNSAELYDPVAGTFSPAGDMMAGRAQGFTATLLANGTVLVAGGTNSTGALVQPSAEIYDPASGTFRQTLEMNVHRVDHTATLLANGKVLIAGGVDAGETPVGAAELYDPDTNAFTSTGGTAPGLDSVRKAILLADGTVFGLMHVENLCSPGDTAVRFDPSTGSFVAAGNRPTFFFPVLTLLSDGTVLLTPPYPANWCFGPPVDVHSADVYDPVTHSFSPAGDMNAWRPGHTATLLSDGTVLVCGGTQRDYPPLTTLASTEMYHPADVRPAPILYSVPGSIQGSILHAGTTELASAGHPASGGEILEIYGAGLLHEAVVPPQVSIGGRLAEVVWFGNAPGYEGLNQIDVRAPGGLEAGPAVPVHLTYFGRPSNEVTIGLR